MARHKSEQKTAEDHWAQRRSDLEHIDRFLLQGRATTGGLLGVKADLRWQQNADGSFELRVSGPFGIGAVTIQGTEQRVEVRTKSGTYHTSDPEKWIHDKMGWTFPIGGLRHWVLGLPSPHSEADIDLNIEGEAVKLEQDGWRLQYNEYQAHGGYDLPRKFEVANDEVKLKVVVDSWSDLPPPK